MARSSFGSVVLLCVSTGLCFFCQSQVNADDRKREVGAIKKQYEKIVQGYKAKDPGVFERMTTTDFAWKGRSGQIVPKDKIFTSIERSVQRVQSFKTVKSRIGAVAVTGDQATADYTLELVAVVKFADGHARTLETDRSSFDTWVKQSGEWKLKTVEIRVRTMALDGKPVKRQQVPPPSGSDQIVPGQGNPTRR